LVCHPEQVIRIIWYYRTIPTLPYPDYAVEERMLSGVTAAGGDCRIVGSSPQRRNRIMIFFQIAIVAINALLGGAMLSVMISAVRQPNSDPPGRARRLAGNTLMYLACIYLVGASLSKFAHVPHVVAEMDSLNMAGWKLTLVASLELLTGLLFSYPPLRSIGLLVITAYLGGAICAHVANDQYFAVLPATLVLGFCWLGVALRHPQMLWSLREYGLSGSKGMTRPAGHWRAAD
jgi:hypothetical protein